MDGTSLPVAVTGASGNIGGAAIERLRESGQRDVVAIVRDPSRMPSGCAPIVRRADYADRAHMVAALDGVGTLVLVPSDGESAAMLAHHLNVIDAATAVGLKHVVYLSIVDVHPESPFCYATVHRETEQRLKDSGIPVSVVRASLYSEFFVRWVLEAAYTRALRLPTGRGRMSLISRRDVADCLAVRALKGPNPTPDIVTGRRSFHLHDLAAMTESLTGVPIEVDDIELTEFCTAQLREGLSPWWAYAFTSMFTSVREQRFEIVTDDVCRLTGHQPVPFMDIASEALRSRGQVGSPSQ